MSPAEGQKASLTNAAIRLPPNEPHLSSSQCLPQHGKKLYIWHPYQAHMMELDYAGEPTFLEASVF